MTNSIAKQENSEPTFGATFGRWLQDPMGSVLAATGSVISSFVLVLGGIGIMNILVQ